MFPFSVNNLITFQKIIRVINSVELIIFFLSLFSCTNIHDSRTAGEGEDISLKSSLPIPPASQTLRH